MSLKELIRKKRDGLILSPEEIKRLISGFLSHELADYQAAAFLMAVFLKGLDRKEMEALTETMWKSGITFPRDRSQSEYWIDKHSTGGIGDKTSLILVPLVSVVTENLLGKGAVKIPMVSGRGLGHTGGTLDKLESVPGFRTAIPIEEARERLKENGFFMMGQTKEMAPADRLLYALRDATCTVESLPLIVASIMSKKLSENLDGLVFDVKIGRGAFLSEASETKKLAGTLVQVAKDLKLDTVAVLTAMDEPLGTKVGHHLEVEECYDFVSNIDLDPGLKEVTLTLASWMVHLASHKKISTMAAREACEKQLGSQTLKERFITMFTAQGGDWSAFSKRRETYREWPAPYLVKSPTAGILSQVDSRACGFLIQKMGGGRMTKESVIDPLVGIELCKKVGDKVSSGDVLARIYHRELPSSELQTFEREAFAVKVTAKPTSWIVEVIS